jgi:SWI/SNF-related matrix-associated actin-dependent regulator 1 of chromatin subfamily A
MELKTASYLKEREIVKVCFPNKKANDKIIRDLCNIPMAKEYHTFWELPISQNLVDVLKKHGFIFNKSLENWREEVKIENNKLTLYPYQIECVDFADKFNGRVLFGDEPGLGKTIEALFWLLRHPKFKPILVICPSNVKIKWERETRKCIPQLKPIILNGTIPYPFKSDFIIINYDILTYWYNDLKEINFDTIILDEAHMIKNNQTKRTKAFKRLVKGVPHLLALTGTPIENKPVEIYNIVYALNPLIFPNYYSFTKEYCGAKKTRFGWDTSGATNTAKLNMVLKKFIMIRHKKSEVLPQLPPKISVVIPLKIDNWNTYLKAENEFIRYIQEKYFINKLSKELEDELRKFAKDNKIEIGEDILTEQDIQLLRIGKMQKVASAPVLTKIEILKQLAIEGKMNQIIDWIETFLESGEKLVVFAFHKKTINKLMEYFPDAVKVDGSVVGLKRQKAIDAFQTKPNVRLFIGNILSTGLGIELTAATNAAVLELPWSPGKLSQATDRLHRISNHMERQVTIWYLLGADTIEEKIRNILAEKEKVLNRVLDGKIEEDTSILMDLINSYKQIKTK